MKPENLDFAGMQLNFLPNLVPEDKKHRYAYYVVSLLGDGWRDDWYKMLGLSVLKTLFYKPDPLLLAITRNYFKLGFRNLFSQLQSMEVNPENLAQAEIFKRNCMCFLPYFSFQPGEHIALPQWFEDHWELVEYETQPLLLTPRSKGLHLFSQKNDKFISMTLNPVDHPKAPAHLVFLGTPYPAYPGFWLGIKADTKAKTTVGEMIYKQGYPIINSWINEQTRDIHISGISLGGSLALQTATHLGDKIKDVHAYNPAGLYERKKKYSFDRWDEIEHKPFVRVIRQGRDPVSRLGVFKQDWQLTYLKPSKKNAGKICLLDHALNFAGEESTQFSPINPEDQNHDNHKINVWIYSRLRTLLYYLAIVPAHYLARPVVYFIYHHWKALTTAAMVMTGAATCGLLITGLVPPAMGALTVTLALGSVLTAYGVHNALSHRSHDPEALNLQDIEVWNRAQSAAYTLDTQKNDENSTEPLIPIYLG